MFSVTTPVVFNSPDRGVPVGRSPYNFTQMSADGQRPKWLKEISENFNRLSRVHERYRQTDDRQTDDRRTDGRRHIANMNLSSRT